MTLHPAELIREALGFALGRIQEIFFDEFSRAEDCDALAENYDAWLRASACSEDPLVRQDLIATWSAGPVLDELLRYQAIVSCLAEALRALGETAPELEIAHVAGTGRRSHLRLVPASPGSP